MSKLSSVQLPPIASQSAGLMFSIMGIVFILYFDFAREAKGVNQPERVVPHTGVAVEGLRVRQVNGAEGRPDQGKASTLGAVFAFGEIVEATAAPAYSAYVPKASN